MFMFNPIDYGWMPRCLIRQLTGLSCPGCGLLRAVHAAAHGRMAEAVAYNYWLLLVLPYVLAVAVQAVLAQGRVKDGLRRLTAHRCVIAFYIVTCLLWFVLRNVYGV